MRTAWANELLLDEERSSYNDLTDGLRLACKMCKTAHLSNKTAMLLRRYNDSFVFGLVLASASLVLAFQSLCAYAQNGTTTVNETSIGQEKWTSYSDPLFGIKVNYPNDWMLVQDSSDHLRLKNATITTLMTIDVKDTAPDETLDKLTRQYGEELKNTFASGPRILQETNPINIISINKTSIGSNNTAANELVYEIGQPSDLQIFSESKVQLA